MKFKEIHIGKGLSFPAFSLASDVPVRTIEDIEKRKGCKVSTALKLAVSLDELCGDK